MYLLKPSLRPCSLNEHRYSPLKTTVRNSPAQFTLVNIIIESQFVHSRCYLYSNYTSLQKHPPICSASCKPRKPCKQQHTVRQVTSSSFQVRSGLPVGPSQSATGKSPTTRRSVSDPIRHDMTRPDSNPAGRPV